MADPYANIVETDAAIVAAIAERLELRAADPNQAAMREAYLSRIDTGDGSRILEVGCGTGAVTRALAAWPGTAAAVGIDPSPVLIERARDLAAGLANISFQIGDALALPYEAASFDVVVFHTALCHIAEPQDAVGQAFRVLRPGGTVAVFDGDYATATVALAEHDPLQACSRAVTENNVMDRWLVRRLPQILTGSGFRNVRTQSHGYVDNDEPEYMLGHAMRGAEILEAQGVIGAGLAEALKDEARQRASEGRFFGHIAYASFIARKPARSAGA